ncbi:hypothetical protein L2719_00800 [Shewanella schlegeliana]|uniref:Uncharacterized protein n=1 Tax=Shewanella schlegeliana TaxID=190308 RepID=A0ABS1SVQ0_9GAMM|nr:hypothetical protein [Shewanella schlegeliana]MBL4912430.1 hypothetical protein [Shewanella schlegeliana]MCL1108100.1 hypothetical protein [Shewanella schlegeliana]GIU21782.1 hypothetical protein TUM4433_01580 [Shewanella schlegeliana]
MEKSVIKTLKILHWMGLSMLLCSVGTYFLSDMSQQVEGMVMIASLAGLGMVMMSPFPIALFLEWARKQNPD